MEDDSNPHLVERASHWNDQSQRTAEAVVRNAARLLDDAALLRKYQRYGTAYTLATLAFEEAGKTALSYWGDTPELKRVSKGWSYHIRKQAAAGCLLLADIANDIIDAHPARAGHGTSNPGAEDEEADLLEVLAQALAMSKPARLMDMIALQAMEKTKQLGFYADEWVIEAGLDISRFSEADCSLAMQQAQAAVRHLRSAVHLSIARALYLSGPLEAKFLEVGRAFGGGQQRVHDGPDQPTQDTSFRVE